MNDEAFPTPWVRAALEPAILGLVAEAPLHGYAITSRLEAARFGRLKGGSIYPVLLRLEKEGLVLSTWVAAPSGPGRKEYQATAAGRARLVEQLTTWSELTRTLHELAHAGTSVTEAPSVKEGTSS